MAAGVVLSSNTTHTGRWDTPRGRRGRPVPGSALDYTLHSYRRVQRLAANIDRYPKLAHPVDSGELDLVDEDSVCE